MACRCRLVLVLCREFPLCSPQETLPHARESGAFRHCDRKNNAAQTVPPLGKRHFGGVLRHGEQGRFKKKKKVAFKFRGLCAQGGAVWLSVEFPGRGTAWLQEVPLWNVRDLVRLVTGSLLESRHLGSGRHVLLARDYSTLGYKVE